MRLTVAFFIYNADIDTTPAAGTRYSERLASKGKGKPIPRKSSEAKRGLASDLNDKEENSEEMCVGSKDQIHTCLF